MQQFYSSFGAQNVSYFAVFVHQLVEMAHRFELEDNWDDVRYVEHEGAEDWARQSKQKAAKSEFAKRLRAEAKVSCVCTFSQGDERACG